MFFINILLLIIDKMSSRAGWKGFADRIWPVGRSLETPAEGYLQIFKAGYFSSSEHQHCHWLRKKHCHVLQLNHKLWLCFTSEVGPHQADIFVEGKMIVGWCCNQPLKMFFNTSGGWKCPVAFLLVAGSATKTFQHHFETRAANVWDLVQHGSINIKPRLSANFFSERSS